jgi:hypothetical protein
MSGILLDEIFTEENTMKVIAKHLIMSPVDEVITFPNQIRRLKNLFEGLTIAIGALIDYPLGAGTVSKILFEVNDARRNGATQFYIPMPLNLVRNDIKGLEEWVQEIATKIYSFEDIYFVINSEQLKEVEKISFGKKLQTLKLKKLALVGESEISVFHSLELLKFDNESLSDVKLLVQSEEIIRRSDKGNYFVRFGQKGENYA